MANAVSGRDRAYEYLRAELLSDPELPGTFISEQDVAQAVGVSRTPVREALLMLSAQHLVQLVPHRGAFVPRVTAAEAVQVFAVRGMIEKWCARDAISADRAPIEEMRTALERQRGLAHDAQAFIEADRDFHALLIDACGNDVLAELYESLRVRHVLIGVTAVSRPGSRLEAVLAEHAEIVAALAAGDVARAEDTIDAHLELTRRRLVGG